MKSLEEYESHYPFRTAGDSDSVKDATRAMMNIVETVSEKGKMTDNQYLEMMNHLLTIHKSEETPIVRQRPRSEYVRMTAAVETARGRSNLDWNRVQIQRREHIDLENMNTVRISPWESFTMTTFH